MILNKKYSLFYNSYVAKWENAIKMAAKCTNNAKCNNFSTQNVTNFLTQNVTTLEVLSDEIKVLKKQGNVLFKAKQLSRLTENWDKE